MAYAASLLSKARLVPQARLGLPWVPVANGTWWAESVVRLPLDAGRCGQAERGALFDAVVETVNANAENDQRRVAAVVPGHATFLTVQSFCPDAGWDEVRHVGHGALYAMTADARRGLEAGLPGAVVAQGVRDCVRACHLSSAQWLVRNHAVVLVPPSLQPTQPTQHPTRLPLVVAACDWSHAEFWALLQTTLHNNDTTRVVTVPKHADVCGSCGGAGKRVRQLLVCDACGAQLPRDANAARNMLLSFLQAF